MKSRVFAVSSAIGPLFAIGAVMTIATIGGCNGLLGITEATVDPSIAADASGNVDATSSDSATLDSGTPGTPDTGNPYTCDSYCTNIMQNCTLDNQEYLNRDVCLAMCSHFELGVAGEEEHDSLACRVYHAAAAAGDPGVHCRHAGPTGAGHCGPQPCEAFCLLENALCGGHPYDPYDGGESTCRAQCPQFTYVSAGEDAGDLTFTSGNTLNCRIYHLESAYDLGNPAAQTTHCPHTGVISAACN